MQVTMNYYCTNEVEHFRNGMIYSEQFTIQFAFDSTFSLNRRRKRRQEINKNQTSPTDLCLCVDIERNIQSIKLKNDFVLTTVEFEQNKKHRIDVQFEPYID